MIKKDKIRHDGSDNSREYSSDNDLGLDSDNKDTKVVNLGDVSEKDNKCKTNKIQIHKEIPWSKLLNLVNLGRYNGGFGNTGSNNSGSFDTGDNNSGNWNTGDNNSGDMNTGSFNSKNCNTGNNNGGGWNTGSNNNNDLNTGDNNSGRGNSGDGNIGDSNTGDGNFGDSNSGDYNLSSYNSGCFNTKQHKLKFFDKETDMTMQKWRRSKAHHLLRTIDCKPTEWIPLSKMTDAEKEQHPEYKTTKGYLKICNNENAYIDWWNNLSNTERKVIKEIPNFDPDKFFKITGIRV